MRFLPFAIFLAICAVAVVIGCTAVLDGVENGGTGSGDQPLTAKASSGTAGEAATVCSSQTRWPNTPDGSPVMNPGETCISCHKDEGGPDFVVAGTVYPTLHEPNDCNGIDGEEEPALVVVEDSFGRQLEAKVNRAGNFFLMGNVELSFPVRARVVVGGRERVMKRTVSTGNCNSCHTERGTFGSPGRIQAP